MKIHLHYIVTVLITGILLNACTPKPNDPSPSVNTTNTLTSTGTITTTGNSYTSNFLTKTVKNLPADPSEVSNSGGQPTVGATYTLYSFKDSTIIANSDSATSKWDIGFNATTIIINGGTSGPGLSAAQVYIGVYDDLKEAPIDGYKVDNKSASPPTAIPTGSGNGWYNYNSNSHIITPIPGRVLLFRTADGAHYAKVQIISYYKNYPLSPTDDDMARYFTFRYAYQPDGSNILK